MAFGRHNGGLEVFGLSSEHRARFKSRLRSSVRRHSDFISKSIQKIAARRLRPDLFEASSNHSDPASGSQAKSSSTLSPKQTKFRSFRGWSLRWRSHLEAARPSISSFSRLSLPTPLKDLFQTESGSSNDKERVSSREAQEENGLAQKERQQTKGVEDHPPVLGLLSGLKDCPHERASTWRVQSEKALDCRLSRSLGY
jgi:hypothetical protein